MSRLYKRVVGILLILTLCLGSVTIAGADENPAYEEDIRDAMGFLKMLDIIPDYDEFNLNINGEIRRADFAVATAKLLNCGTFKGTGIYYYDVAQTHWAYNEIAYLTQIGILNGNGNKIFRPDDVILKAEAFKILLTVLGYSDYVQTTGGYPYGYMTTAGNLGIDDGFSSSEYLNMGEMILLLYNAATVPVFETTGFSANSVTYSVSEEDTLLTLYHDIYCVEDVVYGVDGISIGDKECERDAVLIGDEKYESALAFDDYLGHEVLAFYRLNTKNDNKTIIWAEKLDEAHEIYVDNDASFDAASFRLTYYPSDDRNSKTVSLSRGITVVYNGEVMSENIYQIFNLPTYNLKLIKTDGKYSVAIVTSYENLVVGSIDSIGLNVYDKTNSGIRLSVDEDNYEVLQLKNSLGQPVEFDKIAVGNVLSYAKSPNGEILEIYVITEQINGKIDAVVEDQEEYIITVNSSDYRMAKNANTDAIRTGNNVLLYLDIRGDVAYADVTDNTTFPAYLINSVSSKSPLDSVPRFRILTSEGVKYLDGSDKITLDGQKLNGENVLGKLYVDGAFEPQFAMVGTNKDNEINFIDTIRTNEALEGENYLRESIPYNQSLHFKQVGTLGPMGTINDKTLFFSVPSEDPAGAGDDEFYVIAKNNIVDAVAVKGESYKTKDRIAYEQFVVLKDYAGDPLGKDNPIVVTNISQMLDTEGNTIEVVEGFQGGTAVKLQASEDVSFEGISEGDIIRIKKSVDNEIMDYTILLDCSNPEKYIAAPQMDTWSSCGVGYVYDIVDDVAKIGYKKPVELEWSIAIGSKPVLVCEQTNRGMQIEFGSINDALTKYNESNDDTCSLIFTLQKNCVTEFAVIYR